MQEQGLAELMPQARIPADTGVVTLPAGQSLNGLIHESSETADLVFVGMRKPEVGAEADYAANMRELAEGLGTVVFVHNASRFSGRLI